MLYNTLIINRYNVINSLFFNIKKSKSILLTIRIILKNNKNIKSSLIIYVIMTTNL